MMLMMTRYATLLSVVAALLLHSPSVTAQSTAQSAPQDYPAVKIAGLWWMQHNLNVTRYRNGDSIPDGTADHAAWAKLTSGAWAYPDSNIMMRSTFGILYNAYAVSDPRGLCPTGWRLPTHDEWTGLTNALGGETKAGAKLKGKVGWFP
ncbi:MAG: FISUMP domain-containing protein, partial [Bacteroidota bacterium]